MFVGFWVSGILESGILGKWDFGKWDFVKVGFRESGILGKWDLESSYVRIIRSEQREPLRALHEKRTK